MVDLAHLDEGAPQEERVGAEDTSARVGTEDILFSRSPPGLTKMTVYLWECVPRLG